MRPPPRRVSVVFGSFLLLGACAEGGKQDRVESEVRITADHHMYGFKAEQAFPRFPIEPQDLQVEDGVLGFNDESRWTLDGQPGSRYELAKTGALVFRVPNGRNPDLVFQGGYGLSGDTGLFFFADTVKPKVGLFFGARIIRAAADVTGDFHAFSLLVITRGAVADPDNVARAFAGSLTTDASGAVTAGEARESTGHNLTLTGNLRSFNDGSVEVGLSLDHATARTPRAFTAAATVTQSQPVTTSVILGHETADNDAAGMIALVRKRDGRANLADLAGEYWVGILTVFPNPSNAGTEGSYGTLTISDTGGWRIDARDSTTTYRLSGTLEIDADGAMRLTNNATREEWRGAFDQDYKTIVFVDHDLTGTSASRPELNFFFALRKDAE
ncbi:MAG TPA: hypothetical protein VK081_00620 [Planctomycetota bacterium]|nr:hypothetical protein [Planctomycetota bacterium]